MNRLKSLVQTVFGHIGAAIFFYFENSLSEKTNASNA